MIQIHFFKKKTLKNCVLNIKTNLLVISLIAFTCNCFAQDIIVTKDSKRIDAKVLEVNVDNIRYKIYDFEDGPTYTILKSDIVTILYKNGLVENYVTETSSKTVSTAPMDDYYDCIKIKPNELLAEMKSNNYELYKLYYSGDKMSGNGGGLLGVSLILHLIGGAFIITNFDEEKESNKFIIGTVSVAVGQVLLAIGIPVKAAGNGKKKSAIKNYCQQQYSASAQPHLEINMNVNRVGIAYKF